MKKIYFLALIFALTFTAKSQNQEPVIAATKMNVLYRGLPNPIEVAVPGVDNSNVTLQIVNGTISKTDNGYEVTPGSEPETIIKIVANGKLVGEKKFRVKNIPKPMACFNNMYEGKISRADMLKTDFITAEMTNFAFDISFEVVSYVYLKAEKSITKEMPVASNKIDENIKTILTELKAGDMIVFQDVRAKGPDGKVVKLNPIVLTLKD